MDTPRQVPYDRIETLFLDVGNTLITMDLSRVAVTLGGHGIACSVDELARAEASARPAVSARVAAGSSTETPDLFAFYLDQTLSHLAGASDANIGSRPRASLASAVAAALRPPGGSDSLWNTVLPGIPQALATLADLGLQLVVVSNSDGTVERSLTRLGLRPFFAAVLDSGVVGFEKPDPRIFAAALAQSGARRDHTLHFGDLYHVDVVGARGAGIHAALVDPFDTWTAARGAASAVECDRFRDLTALAAYLAVART